MTMLQLPWPITSGVNATASSQLLRLKNTTNFSNSKVLEIVRFCMSKEMSDMLDFDITLSNYRKYMFRGKCYPQGCWMHKLDPRKPLIIVRISSKENAFPYWVDYSCSKSKNTVDNRKSLSDNPGSYAHRGYISHWLLTREECLVHVLAHEMRHVWQINHKQGWVRRSRGRSFSERDADAFAIKIVRAWRRINMSREVEQAFCSASLFLFQFLRRTIAVLLAIKLNRRSTIQR